jgi:outer membrane protein, heavy metal efflux system
MESLLRVLVASTVTLAAAACATPDINTPQDISDRIKQQAGHATRDAAAEPAMPSGVSIGDGLTESEAIAIGLWNNSGFQDSLADLGIARADLAQAGLLRNPVLSLLFPWGPKQLEATLRWPIEQLWQRPSRVAAAKLNADAVAERLVARGLNLVADVRMAYVALLRARTLELLASENAMFSRRIAELSRSRFKAGDISELEADTADTDAARAELAARSAATDAALAENALNQVMGVGEMVRPGEIRLSDTPVTALSCDDVALAALEKEALAARPDVRAAELDIEAAGRRLGWEESRIFSLIAVLDFNGEGKEGAELGPGLETDFGLFDRNQAGTMRASADLNRARARYQTTRQQIVRDVRDAYSAVTNAGASAARWREDVRPRLERQAGQTQRAYELGELSYLAVIESLRRLNEGRISELDAAIAMRRAMVQLEHRIGRSCAP